jgi:PBP1b-binding outer membrane lipoprotein LpoB
MDVFGNCIGVIQATNKKSKSVNSPQSDEELHQEGFSKHDELILKSLATHISVALQNMHSESETSIKEVIQMLKNDSTS